MRYQQHKGRRVKSYKFIWVQNRNNLYWLEKEKRWVSMDDAHLKHCSNAMSPCRSVKAFRRRLKEWSKYLPSGTKFILVSRYANCDIMARTREQSKQ